MTEIESELDIDASDLDDEYQHATCVQKHPWGSLKPGSLYSAVCGKEILLRAPGDYKKCPECAEHLTEFMKGKVPCNLCGKVLSDHLGY